MNNSKVIDAQKLFVTSQEQEWIAQAKQGSQTAFHQLYEMHHRQVYALCWRMLADKYSAEDVCQEVFVVLWQKINNFRGESKFSTWLHSVASNVVLTHLRKQKQAMLVSYGQPDMTHLSVKMQNQLIALAQARKAIEKALANDENNADLLNLLRFTQQQELSLLQQLYPYMNNKNGQWQTI